MALEGRLEGESLQYITLSIISSYTTKTESNFLTNLYNLDWEFFWPFVLDLPTAPAVLSSEEN